VWAELDLDMTRGSRTIAYRDLPYNDQVRELLWREEVLKGRPSLSPLNRENVFQFALEILSSLSPSGAEELNKYLPISNTLSNTDSDILDIVKIPTPQPKMFRPPGMPDNHPDILAGLYI